MLQEAPELLPNAIPTTNPQVKDINCGATTEDQGPSTSPLDSHVRSTERIPLLQLHPFYNCDNTENGVSVEVAVIFMHGGDEDVSSYSPFLCQESELSLRTGATSPNRIPPPLSRTDSEAHKKYTEAASRIEDITKGIGEGKTCLTLAEVDVCLQSTQIIHKYLTTILRDLPKTEKLDTQNLRTTNTPIRSKPQFSKICWLEDKDMLPSLIPDGRIMGYGFDISRVSSKLDFKAAAELFAKAFKLNNYSTTPVVLIDHGYGNVIIEALLCNQHPDIDTFKKLTAAVVLFASPISIPLELAEWSTKKMKLPKSATKKAFLTLRKDSKELKNLWKNFITAAQGWDTSISMYLTKHDNVDSKSTNEEAANEIATSPQRNGVDIFQTAANFDDIASFSSTEDGSFLRVSSQIVKAIQVWQLLRAAVQEDEASLTRLIHHFININLAGKTGQNALLLSALQGNIDTLKVLLGERQLNIDHQNKHGDTALHLAVISDVGQETKREEILSLLRAGASPEITNCENKKPKKLVLKGCIGIKNLFTKNRPLVEGPLVQPKKHLKKSRPPGQEGIKACKSLEMYVTEMYFKQDSSALILEQHWTMYKTVYDLIYS